MRLCDYKILERAAKEDWDTLYEAFREFEYYLDEEHKINSDLYTRLEGVILQRKDFTTDQYMSLSGLLSNKYQSYLWRKKDWY